MKLNENEETISNPFIDKIHNGKWTELKTAVEQTVAKKIHDRVENKKMEIIDKAIGK